MPPEVVKVAEPVELPKHNTLVTAVELASAPAGCVMLAVAAIVQLLASVTVTVLAPAFNDEITEVVWAPDHR